jgi:hypothetical protein
MTVIKSSLSNPSISTCWQRPPYASKILWENMAEGSFTMQAPEVCRALACRLATRCLPSSPFETDAELFFPTNG